MVYNSLYSNHEDCEILHLQIRNNVKRRWGEYFIRESEERF
jgi:hypothetical protein